MGLPVSRHAALEHRSPPRWSEPQIRWRQRLESLQWALAQLRAALDALAAARENEVIGMAVIKAYEFSFELSWKTLKDLLHHEGIDALLPREVLRGVTSPRWGCP